jgi:hypothetical protein
MIKTILHSIGGLVVKLAVAIGDQISMIRPAPGSIPGRCILPASKCLLLHSISSVLFFCFQVEVSVGSPVALL